MKKIKVLITVNEFGHFGGIVNFYRIFFRRFKADNIQLIHHVIGSRMKDFHKPSKRIIIYPWHYFKDITRLIWQLSTDRHIKIVQVNPSLIPLALVREAGIILIAKLFAKKVIVFIQGWKEPYLQKIKTNRLIKYLFTKIYGSSDIILVLARRFSESLQTLGIPAEKIQITKTMFEAELIEEKKYTSNGNVEFLYLSRISRLKGIFELIDATATLAKTCKNFRITVVGHGVNADTVSDIKEKIKSLGISDYFQFKGHLGGKAKFEAYSSVDVYVFPSWHEGCPTSVLEALASGLFVISTDVGALGEILSDGVNGRFVNVRDPKDLAEKMAWTIKNIDKVRQLGKKNKSYAFENFESEKVVSQIKQIYRDIIVG